eukprot:693880-Karenia_brevis.AAC.1
MRAMQENMLEMMGAELQKLVSTMPMSSAYPRIMSPGPIVCDSAISMQSVTRINIVELKEQPCLTPEAATNAKRNPD